MQIKPTIPIILGRVGDVHTQTTPFDACALDVASAQLVIEIGFGTTALMFDIVEDLTCALAVVFR